MPFEKQLTLPLRNRVAQADAARDEIQVRQTEIRLQQLRNQAQLEVEDALYRHPAVMACAECFFLTSAQTCTRSAPISLR